MRRLWILMIPLFLNAESLKDLMEFAAINNDLVVSKRYGEQAGAKELDAKKSAYFPTVDVGGYYKRDDEPSPFQAGDVYGAYAKIALDVYDGGKKASQIDQADFALESSTLDALAYKKSLALQITQDFFGVKSLQSSLNSREEAQKSLKAQLERIGSFYEAKMATKDDVDRVRADFDTNVYNMESIKFQILSLKSALELKVGKPIKSLDDSAFNKTLSIDYETLESVKALVAQESSLKSRANAIDSVYYPNVKVEDAYGVYGYDREDPMVKPLDKQNTLLLTLNLRVFDDGSIAKSKEAVLLNAQALNSQIAYQTKEQAMRYSLSKASVQTANARIKSAFSALNSATSAFETIEKKYNAGIVDYVVYLDALTKKTSSRALYESGLNDLEVAYATLYFYAGKNIKEELK